MIMLGACENVCGCLRLAEAAGIFEVLSPEWCGIRSIEFIAKEIDYFFCSCRYDFFHSICDEVAIIPVTIAGFATW